MLPRTLTAFALLVVGPRVYAQQPLEPFTPEQRWAHYLHRTFHPQRLGLLAAETAIDHATEQPSCWNRDAQSYALRYTRAFERRFIRNTAQFGAGILTGEDLRYRPSHSAGLQAR